ncbi:biotin-dependent carboxyltransferase family protein [Alteromonas sp. ASW11-130]|uniref:5-oxoprolinase subunit C family protein n=1 Tax=Alteromonas sp. ASW11-130 TaxID=3015775 RepID=UPI0022429414|nr:biotin-dependent carboxyltransferase family protein [Alteromonas sp. ASW11-130]MCW8092042.1 biotin-dependent carboxyltransferase family protein [Alteromonas sp. ASW11-130]
MTSRLPITIVIDNPGLCAIIVDTGRTEGQDRGFSEAGPLDEEAYFWANWLCGNEVSEPAIECIGSIAFTVKAHAAMAVTGPEVTLTINGEEHAAWKTLTVDSDDNVAISTKCSTAKFYVAIGGVWLLNKVMGSACTVSREGMGGLHEKGQPLIANDSIPIRVGCVEKKDVPKCLQPDYASVNPVDIVLGYQFESFRSLARRRFFSTEYVVTSDINRMGYRLKGAAVTSDMKSMRSEGINFGAIQFPQDGQPIIMLRDRQTLGGYPKIGCVAPYDIPRLVQTPIDGAIRFKECAASDARTNWLLARVQRARFINGK